MIQLYHNNRCGKSREALKMLEDSGMEFEIIRYLDNPPNINQLREVLKKLNYKPLELVRQTEPIWIEKFKTIALSDGEIIDALVKYPSLIERPILIDKDNAIVARTPEKVNEFILGF
jgi:arsenate reductase